MKDFDTTSGAWPTLVYDKRTGRTGYVVEMTKFQAIMRQHRHGGPVDDLLWARHIEDQLNQAGLKVVEADNEIGEAE